MSVVHVRNSVEEGAYGTSYTNRKTKEYDLLNEIVRQTRRSVGKRKSGNNQQKQTHTHLVKNLTFFFCRVFLLCIYIGCLCPDRSSLSARWERR